jgi:hypothetical protein
VHPVDQLQQRLLERELAGGSEVRAVGEVAAAVGEQPVAVPLGEGRQPGVRDVHLVAADVELRQAERGRVAERRQAHHLALVALPDGQSIFVSIE